VPGQRYLKGGTRKLGKPTQQQLDCIDQLWGPADNGVGRWFDASIDELVDPFRDGLLALIPMAERAQLTWRDLNTHDDWEYLARSLYTVFVGNPTALPATVPVKPKPLAPYDYDLDDYSEYSWIEFTRQGLEEGYALIRLLSTDTPFDTLHLVQIDPLSGTPGRTTKLPLVGSWVYIAAQVY
jgi:hypothetical protein